MTDLAEIFERLGLSQYLDGFVEEGFDSWDVVLYATESDLEALGVRLGHRRKLQKEIADARGISIEQVIGAVSRGMSTDDLLHGDSDTRSVTSQGDGKGNIVAGPAKRKYRRHPKPDENAPERAPSAYVIFSNKIREDLKPLKLTFTDIAKTVGLKWQVLKPEEKEFYETQAATAKEQYNTALAKYKRTSQYRDYQNYLADFKARNAPPFAQPSGSKRPKLETEISGASSSGGSVNTVSDPDLRRRDGGTSGPSAYSPIVGSSTASPTAVTKGVSGRSRDSSVYSSIPTTPVNAAFAPGTYPPIPGARGFPEGPHQLARLPPLETRDVRPLIASMISGPSPMVNPRRTPAPPTPTALDSAVLLRQDTSKSSTSSNLSRESGTSSVYTPITPTEDTRSSRSLPRIPALMQHGSSSDSGSEMVEHRPAQGLATRLHSEMGGLIPKSNLGYTQSFHHLSLNPEHRDASRPLDNDSAPRPVLPPVPQGSQQPDPTGTERLDSLSVLAMAGRMIDRDYHDPTNSHKRLG